MRESHLACIMEIVSKTYIQYLYFLQFISKLYSVLCYMHANVVRIIVNTIHANH